jgi:hypothetical protein
MRPHSILFGDIHNHNAHMQVRFAGPGAHRPASAVPIPASTHATRRPVQPGTSAAILPS